MMTFSPNDFAFTILDRAHALRHAALIRSSYKPLDPKETFWLLTENGWRDLLRQKDYAQKQISELNGKRELLGLPIRISILDDPTTPEIELCMIPML